MTGFRFVVLGVLLLVVERILAFILEQILKDHDLFPAKFYTPISISARNKTVVTSTASKDMTVIKCLNIFIYKAFFCELLSRQIYA